MSKKGNILRDATTDKIDPADLVMACAEMYITNNAIATVITTQNAFTLFDEATTLTVAPNHEIDMPQNGRLRYTGTVTKNFHAGITFSASNGANIQMEAVIYKNGTVDANKEFTGGTPLTAGLINQKIGTGGDVVSTAIHAFVQLAPNDYVEFAISNESSTGNITVSDINFFMMEMY